MASGGGGPPPPRAGQPHNSDDEDEDEDDDRGANSFVGGERSGLSVENPGRPGIPGGNVVRDLLQRAAEAGPVQSGAPRGAFSGAGNTLGSDEIESTFIPDPDAEVQESAIRNLTFWKDGFSIEDGELMRYDNPQHAQILDEINSGRAPPSILNVAPGQPVELRVARRVDEEYRPSQSSAPRTFTGSGNRLGSPVPAVSSGSTSTSMPGNFPTAPSSAPEPPESARSSIQTRFEVDQSQPATSIQLRMADGTRMVCRMNLTHTIGDIRNFINASNPANAARAYTIGTTFPNRTLENNAETIKDAGLANSVIVQRWA